MKKIISVLLVLVTLGTGILNGVEVFAVEDKDIQSFIHSIVELVSYQTEPIFSTDSIIEKDTSTGIDFSTCRLIVKANEKPDELNSIGMASGFKDYYIIQFENETDAQAAYDFYSLDDDVISVGVDKMVEAFESDVESTTQTIVEQPDETPTRLNSWGAESIGLYALKDYINNKNISLNKVTVGVVGTGVDLDQKFFEGRLERTYFDSSESNSGVEQDYNGHETAVTSVIVDSTPENVVVRNYKAGDDGKYLYTSYASAILQAVVDDVDIINCSAGINFGYNAEGDPIYELLSDVIKTAYDNDIILVNSAGNYMNDCLEPEVCLPASSEYALTVTANDFYSMPPGWTAIGKCVDVIAPGVEINVITIENRYNIADGTSYSSPYVASVCAMVKAFHPDYSMEQIIDSVKGTATPLDEHYGYLDELCGTGIVDAIGAVGLERPTLSVNVEPGKYDDEINIEVYSQDEVYHTVDLYYPTPENGTLYTEPVKIYATEEIFKAVAYNEDGIPSKVFSGLYRSSILADENDFTIDEDGSITSYTGSLHDIIIPSTIDGIEVTDVSNGAFSSAEVWGITLPDTVKVLSGKGSTPRNHNSFMNDENLIFIDGNGVVEIGPQAFKSCHSLRFVNFPNVKKVGYEAFTGENSIVRLSMPNVTTIGDGCFANTLILYLHLPELTTCGRKSFSSARFYELYCPKLKYIEQEYSVNTVMVFADTELRTPVDLRDIEDFEGKDTFTNMPNELRAPAARLEFSNLKSLTDLPGSPSKLVLPSTVENMPSDLRSYKVPGYTIYGSSGTYIENWAKKNGFKFIEVTPETALVSDLPQYYKSYMVELEVDVIGFNRQYQWYANTVDSNEGGTAIEGATSKDFNPADYPAAPYYYCVVTSQDVGYEPMVIKSSVCENRAALADYSELDEVLAKVPADLSIYTAESRMKLENAINAVEKNLSISKQAQVDEMARVVEDAIKNLKVITVSISTTSVELKKNDKYTITAESESTIHWSSDNPDVATVDENGVVTAVGKGTATITATTETGATASCMVEVSLTPCQWIEYLFVSFVSILNSIFVCFIS